MAITFQLGSTRPELLGVGATVGTLAGFGVLFALAHAGRREFAE
jgi:hypothetical protein